MRQLKIMMVILGLSSWGLSYDCRTDCGAVASFDYPCPTLRKPRRMCEGRDNAIFAACTIAKASSCELWEEVYKSVENQLRTILEPNFNSHRAEETADEAEYMALCEAAAVAACVAIGGEFGGAWGAVLGGAGGTFIANRICKQSLVW